MGHARGEILGLSLSLIYVKYRKDNVGLQVSIVDCVGHKLDGNNLVQKLVRLVVANFSCK